MTESMSQTLSIRRTIEHAATDWTVGNTFRDRDLTCWVIIAFASERTNEWTDVFMADVYGAVRVCPGMRVCVRQMR